MMVGYARVSTFSQSTDGQIDLLKAAGCERIFTETASGRRADRSELAAALGFMRPNDVLCVVRLDKLARSMKQLLTTVEDISAKSMGLRSLNESIDTMNATGRLVFHVFAALGQFEVDRLRERTREGLAASRARGRFGGRPKSLDEAKIKAARAMMTVGDLSAQEIAKQIGCAPSTLYRYLPGGRSGLLEDQIAA